MSFVSRAIALGLVVGLGSALIASCGGHRDATGFCATVQRGHSEFNTVDAAHASTALAEFDRVAKSAPPKLASDLKTVHDVLVLLYKKPKALGDNVALLTSYFNAINRVDAYFKGTCGVDIPKPVKL